MTLLVKWLMHMVLELGVYRIDEGEGEGGVELERISELLYF